MASPSKRQRCANFNKEDKEVLITSIQKHFKVIENKRTDKVTRKEKDDAWDIIAVEFNANSLGKVANVKQIRQFYENWKRKIKREKANEKLELYRTGGGPPIETTLDDVDLELLELIKVQVDSLDNPFDSDGLQRKKLSSQQGTQSTSVTVLPNIDYSEPEESQEREKDAYLEFSFNELVNQQHDRDTSTPTEEVEIVTVNITPTRKVHNITSPRKYTSPRKFLNIMSPQKVHISERGVSNVQASKSNKVHKKKTPSKRENSVIRGEMSTPKNDSTKINDSAVIREEVVSVTKLRADSIKKDQDARTEINDLKKSVLKKKYTNMCEKHTLAMKVGGKKYDNMCEKHTLDMKVGGKKYDNELLRSTLFKKQLKELENLEKQS